MLPTVHVWVLGSQRQSLIEDILHRGHPLRVTALRYLLILLFASCLDKYSSSHLPTLVSMPCLLCLYQLCPPWNCTLKQFLIPKLILIMVFYHSNRKQTSILGMPNTLSASLCQHSACTCSWEVPLTDKHQHSLFSSLHRQLQSVTR